VSNASSSRLCSSSSPSNPRTGTSSSIIPGERPELGGLYRVLRALEEDGLVRSKWDADEPGPAKRMYELTPAGRELLRAWAKALKQTQVVVDAFLMRFEGT